MLLAHREKQKNIYKEKETQKQKLIKTANVLFVGKKHIAMCEESNSKQMTANQPNCHQ